MLKGRRVVGRYWNIATNKKDRLGDIRPKKLEKFRDWIEDNSLFDITANLEHIFFNSKYTVFLDKILVSTEIIEGKVHNNNSDLSDHKLIEQICYYI